MASLERVASRLTRGNDPEERALSFSLFPNKSSFAIGSSLGRYVEEAPKFPLSTSALEEQSGESRRRRH